MALKQKELKEYPATPKTFTKDKNGERRNKTAESYRKQIEKHLEKVKEVQAYNATVAKENEANLKAIEAAKQKAAELKSGKVKGKK